MRKISNSTTTVSSQPSCRTSTQVFLQQALAISPTTATNAVFQLFRASCQTGKDGALDDCFRDQTIFLTCSISSQNHL
eukprot:m.3530 g.3530  ORF g.3530 m.3530 type:complete len:78 (-) comp4083_c0_seq2:729-962(-)